MGWLCRLPAKKVMFRSGHLDHFKRPTHIPRETWFWSHCRGRLYFNRLCCVKCVKLPGIDEKPTAALPALSYYLWHEEGSLGARLKKAG